MRICRMWLGLMWVLALASEMAFGISLCSYRTPAISLVDADLSFAYQFFDDANTAAIDVSTGRIDASFTRLRDTESFGFVARLNAQVGLTNFRASSWLGEGETSFRYYVSTELPLFGFGGVYGIAATGQTQLGLEIRSGFGFGRFYDVTPLAKAMTIHRNLRLSKAVKAPLPDTVLQEIARTIGRLAEFDAVTDAVAAIETSIETASGAQLDARSLLMIEDVLAEAGSERYCGWSAQAGVGYELLDPYGGAQGFLVAMSSDLAFAPDPSGQIEGHVSFSGPFDLMNENTLTGSFSYEIQLTNTSDLEVACSFQRVKPAGLTAVTSHMLSGKLLFEVGTADVLLNLNVSRRTGDAGWSVGFSISTAMDLL